jgi:hypothetical protein
MKQLLKRVSTVSLLFSSLSLFAQTQAPLMTWIQTSGSPSNLTNVLSTNQVMEIVSLSMDNSSQIDVTVQDQTLSFGQGAGGGVTRPACALRDRRAENRGVSPNLLRWRRRADHLPNFVAKRDPAASGIGQVSLSRSLRAQAKLNLALVWRASVRSDFWSDFATVRSSNPAVPGPCRDREL